MKFRDLKINNEVMYYGKKYLIWSIEPPNIKLKRDNDGEVLTVNFYELVINPSFIPANSFVSKNEDIKYKSNLDEASDKNRDKALTRYEIIRPVIILRKAKANDIRSIYEFVQVYNEFICDGEDIYKLRQNKLVERIAKKHQRSVRTINQYISDYYKSENEVGGQGIEGLISKSGIGYSDRTDNKKLIICHPKDPDYILDEIDIRISEEYIPIIKYVIENEYLTSKNISNSTTYRLIKSLCVKEGVEPPNESTIYKILNRIREDIKTKLRKGKKASEKYRPVLRGFSNVEALFPLHMVEIDHTRIDLDVIDEETGYNMGRPWITLGIDVYSRMIWCMYISLEEPSANRVRKALEHGVLFKQAKERYNTFNEWPVYGIPTIIYLDNGTDFKSTNLKRMITETLKTNVMYRPVKTPHYGATIERLFGKLNAELIHSLDGTRKSHFYNLGDYDPEREAILTINDLTEILAQYFTDVYPYKTHRGLPIDENTPAVRFYGGLEKVGIPEFILPDEEELFKIELLPIAMKPYTREGFRLDNVIYMSSELSQYIGTRDIKYKIKYDVDDISRIFFLKPDTKEYVEVPAVLPAADSIKGMNRYTYDKIRKLQLEESKEKLRQIPGASDVDKYEAKLRENVLNKYKNNKTVRKQAKLMNVDFTSLVPKNDQSKSKITLNMLIDNAKKLEEERELNKNV